MSRRLLVTAAATAAALGACSPPPPAGATFRRVDDIGAALPTLRCGTPDGQDTILDVNGNGAALFDADGDGDLDLLLVDGTTRSDLVDGVPVQHHLLRNDGGLRFTDVSDEAAIVMGGWPTGVGVADIDRDGRPDLVIGAHGGDMLFFNRSTENTLRFEGEPLHASRRTPLDWTTSVALADADGDGLLDLYLVRYLELDPADPPLGALDDGTPCRFHGVDVMCGPTGLPPQPDVFLRGLDRAPWFEDATDAAGLDAVPAAYGLGVLFTDLDGDRRPDLYVANDSVDNVVLHNRGDGTFEDVSSMSGAAADMAGAPQAGMGVDTGDVDGDGDLDLVVTNFSDETHTVYRNDGALLFRDVTAAAGIARSTRPLLGWGVLLRDFDGDGHIDLFVSNGHVYAQADDPRIGSAYRQPQLLHRGRGDGRFAPSDFADTTPYPGRSVVCGDLDGDGDLDLVVLSLNEPPRLYENLTDDPARLRLLTLRHEGGEHAYGALVVAREANGRILARPLLSASSFQTSSAPAVSLACTSDLEQLEVHWPHGEVDVIDGALVRAGQHTVLAPTRGVVSSSPLLRPTP